MSIYLFNLPDIPVLIYNDYMRLRREAMGSSIYKIKGSIWRENNV